MGEAGDEAAAGVNMLVDEAALLEMLRPEIGRRRRDKQRRSSGKVSKTRRLRLLRTASRRYRTQPRLARLAWGI
jgi:hypothetical protein